MVHATIEKSGDGYLIIVTTSIAEANGGRHYIHVDRLSVENTIIKKLFETMMEEK
jgi:hypothetical protein